MIDSDPYVVSAEHNVNTAGRSISACHPG